jgi:hypothetical protein
MLRMGAHSTRRQPRYYTLSAICWSCAQGGEYVMFSLIELVAERRHPRLFDNVWGKGERGQVQLSLTAKGELN